MRTVTVQGSEDSREGFRCEWGRGDRTTWRDVEAADLW